MCFRDICGYGYNLYPALLQRTKPPLSRAIILWALTPPPAAGLFAGLDVSSQVSGSFVFRCGQDMRLLFPSQNSWEPGVKWGPSLSWSTQDAANCLQSLDTGFLFPSLSTVQSPTAEHHPPLPPLSFQLSPSCLAYSPHLLSWRACGCDVMWWEVKSSGRL